MKTALSISLSLCLSPLFGNPIVEKENHKLSYYGKVRTSASYIKQNSTQSSAIHVSDHKTRLGLKGSYNLGDGWAAKTKLEVGIDVVDKHKSKDNLFMARDTFLAIASPYGTIYLGRKNSTFKSSIAKVDFLNHTIADADAIMGRTSSGKDINTRYNNSIHYHTPKFLGEKVFMTWEHQSKDSLSGSNSPSNNISINFKNHKSHINLVYYSEKNGLKLSSDHGKAHALRLVLKHTINKYNLGFVYEETKSDISKNSRKAYMLSTKYIFQNNLAFIIQGSYAGNSKADKDKAWMGSIAFQKEFSKGFQTYLTYTLLNADGGGYTLGKQGASDTFKTKNNDKVSAISLGLNYQF